ncbi:HpcH/HpaI aldolase/citrate lyase family protein [Aestuariivirga sp.]|uniref:HpcH/HpaI aldolase family protein n=1 Tax=Aestuariivirga sp. TaxID=2650926 RepID=UPI0035930E7B
MSAAHFDLRTRLASGEPFLFSWMSIPSASLAAQVARLPLDGVCLDMQHGMIGFSDAGPMLAAINAAGKPAMVRALWNDAATAGQALDAGACCVISPMVNTRAQAEALVRSAKYPPMGSRSWGGYTALQASGLPPADYLKQSNQMTMVFAMVETVEALSNLDEIAATPGLDGLFVGPSDLSITLSKGAGIDKLGKDTLAAMAKVSEACKTNGLVAGAFGGSSDVIKAYIKLGYTFIAAAVDVDLLQSGAAALRKSLEV